MKATAEIRKADDRALARQWASIDWEMAEEKLADLQERIAIAAVVQDKRELRALERELVGDIDIRCLAVRHVASSKSGCGVDGEKWETAAKRFRAACSLIPDEYEASPLRIIELKSRNSGKVRRTGIPTYRDKAMMKLYAYYLQPVAEATANPRSYGFRKGRGPFDAHRKIATLLTGSDAPEMVVVADVEACYANISHAWLMGHIPMNKHVLKEFINCGYVFAGKLYPDEDWGISEGSNISPVIANLTLDGMQQRIEDELRRRGLLDGRNVGRLVQFADDCVVPIRTYEQGTCVIEAMESFLRARGLRLSRTKTRVATLHHGFDFLSRTYKKEDGVLSATPSEAAVDRFISKVAETVGGWRKSQRELIERLNRMISGWANYHRYTDARETFAKLDIAIEALLVRTSVEQHRKWTFPAVVRRFFYEEHGEYYYSLPDDRSVRVMKLSEVALARHHGKSPFANPYISITWGRESDEERQAKNITGPYASIWKRQRGMCAYCGRPILQDQEKSLVPVDVTKPLGKGNCAYVHAGCEFSVPEVILTDDPLTAPFDVLRALKETEETADTAKRMRRVKGTKYRPIMEYLDGCEGNVVTLTFTKIEEIIGDSLPASARDPQAKFWFNTGASLKVTDAWRAAGWSLEEVDFVQERLRFVNDFPGRVWAYIPGELTEQRIPDDAKYELANFHDYIIDKYGLRL